MTGKVLSALQKLFGPDLLLETDDRSSKGSVNAVNTSTILPFLCVLTLLTVSAGAHSSHRVKAGNTPSPSKGTHTYTPFALTPKGNLESPTSLGLHVIGLVDQIHLLGGNATIHRLS